MVLSPNSVPMTEPEYLAFEESSEERHEFVNGEVFAMIGGTLRHNVIINNIRHSLTEQLADKNCLVTTSETRVKVDSKITYRYPDILVVCQKIEYAENRKDTIKNPIVLVEVLSPATALIDRNQKLDEYTRIPSLQEYVLITQEEFKVERFLRQPGKDWLYTKVISEDDVLNLPSLECTLALSDVYAKLDLLDDES